ncbi:MAG: tRNA 2-thiouridine(34) synthase MnmA [Proteobacteria bacterium]|nr:tRNA 2-thiouridine(34) synthase MnmA [Pseudomonadota bacterium]
MYIFINLHYSGVDSSVAALLLQLQGHDVTGISMRIYSGSPAAGKQVNACYSPDEEHDIEYARTVAESLGIAFYDFDLKDAYRSNVIDYVAREYCGGKTPNPCVRCNQQVKFSALLDKAAESGIAFDSFATGHYARVAYAPETGRYLLQKARDSRRDQSYFLCMLSQEQLRRTLFPLGDYTKDMVREIARSHNLISHDRADSQDFAAGSYRQFLPGETATGFIKDQNDTILGTHNGIGEFTIGQRRGLNIAMGKPFYVTAIDHEHNTVYVGEEDELFKTGLIAADANWISITSLTAPLAFTVKVRSAHAGAAAVIQPENGGKVRVTFRKPQKSLTPGQWAVFYDNDTVVGGAVIEKTL